MIQDTPRYELRLAGNREDVEAAQRLRYTVFVEELGGDGPLVDHAARLEADQFDPFFDHLILVDPTLPVGVHVIGVYRLLRPEAAARAGQFYSADEYDLAPLLSSGRRVLELGRSCLHPAYRGGAAMYHLWHGLAGYVSDHGIDVLFGVASFHGIDPTTLAAPLSLLHHRHLAPPDLRVRAVPDRFQPMDLLAEDEIDRKAAMVATPALIKAYLRLGGYVGEGAVIDHAFNTTDVCLILDTARMTVAQRALYTTPRRT